MWHIYTMEYHSAIKRNEIELFAVRWMDLESVIQNEVWKMWYIQTMEYNSEIGRAHV